MAYFDTSNPEYNEHLRKLETTDPNHADTFNANFRQLILNDAFLNEKATNPEKVNGHTVESDVPANAKFTDTVYTHPATHPASMITGLPTSLPANGGNADSIGGHPPSHFAQSAWYGVIDFTSATYPSPYIASSTNIPGFPDTDWFHVIYIPHTDPSGGYGAQIAIRFHGDNAFYIRSAAGASWGSWRKMSSDYGTADLTAGVSALATGSLYFVYE
jgi:hypothetical protein